jgi:Domain of unknown function (DUF4345)
MMKLFLLVAGVFLIPVALSYGVDPAVFTPEWRHVAVIWAVFFAYSLAIGRILSLIVDGMPSRILLLYLAVELAVGTGGLFVLARERRKAEAQAMMSGRS